MPASEAKLVFDEKHWNWFDYHRFCIVRNPYARMVSLYHHYLNMRTRISPDLAPTARLKALVKYRLLPRLTFSQYLLRPEKIREIAMPLEEFVLDSTGRSLVDDILTYEKLTEELPPYLQGIGIDVDPGQIPVLGSSGIKDYAAYYDEETRSFVEGFYHYEIESFGYRFEDLS